MPNNFVKRPKKPTKPLWSDPDKLLLKEKYHLLSFEELAELFGKTIRQVKQQAQTQQLSKRKPNN